MDILSLFFLIVITYLKLIINSLYHFNIECNVSEESSQKTYAVLLLNIFAINSIILTNNIFNLFIFCEIYIFTFLAICSASDDSKILRSAFTYFCLSSASTLLFLLSFIVIYLCFGETSFSKIVDNFALISEKKYWYLFLILLSIFLAITLKFFPFWIFYNNIKSKNNYSDLIITEIFFVTCLIGVYLALKFIKSFFGNNLLFVKLNYDLLLITLSFIIITYNSLKIVKEKHLKLIAIDLSLVTLGLVLITLVVQNKNSLKALFYFIINNATSNIILFILAIFIKKNYKTSSIEQIDFSNKVTYLVSLFLKIFIPFVIGLPLSLLFFANYYLCLSLIDYDYKIILIPLLVIANLAYFKLGLDLFRVLYLRDDYDRQNYFNLYNIDNKKSWQLAFFLNIILIVVLMFNISFLEKFSNKFAQYFLL